MPKMENETKENVELLEKPRVSVSITWRQENRRLLNWRVKRLRPP